MTGNWWRKTRRTSGTGSATIAAAGMAAAAGLIGTLTIAAPTNAPTTGPTTAPVVSPATGQAAYAYHLDGDLKNAGTAGPAGDLADLGFASFVDSPLGQSFGKAGFDAAKMGHNHVKVPLASLTDSNGSFTVEAVFLFPTSGPNSDPDRAKFTIAAYGGEEDGPAGTSGGGFYLNYNGDADTASLPGHAPGQWGRVQFVVDDRSRDKSNGFSRKLMVNALVPVAVVPGHVYRAVAAWDNTTGIARIGWSEVKPGAEPASLPAVLQLASPTGETGLVIDGTRYFLTVGTAESEDGGNGFASKNVTVDDVRFVAGVDKSAFTLPTTVPSTR